MLFELEDYDSLIEYSFTYNHLNICQFWQKSEEYFGSPVPIIKVSEAADYYTFRMAPRQQWHTCTHFSVNGCHMLLYQVFNDNINAYSFTLVVPRFSSENGQLRWVTAKLRDARYYPYDRIYPSKNGIILNNTSYGSLEIKMKFSTIIYTHNDKSFTSVVPTLSEPIITKDVPKGKYIDAGLAFRQIVLPRNLSGKSFRNFKCQKHGDYYMCGDGPQHILVQWDIKYVKYMSKNVRLYIKYILLCVQHKQMYIWIPKILWTTFILPSVIYHMPSLGTSYGCSIF